MAVEAAAAAAAANERTPMEAALARLEEVLRPVSKPPNEPTPGEAAMLVLVLLMLVLLMRTGVCLVPPAGLLDRVLLTRGVGLVEYSCVFVVLEWDVRYTRLEEK
jgi:hypothetical protein